MIENASLVIFERMMAEESLSQSLTRRPLELGHSE
jgi:hypothetical protein